MAAAAPSQPSPEPSPITLRRLAVEGFKSIAARVAIELSPITLLAGANSSGKSSVMQALLLLKQTLEAPFDAGPLRIDGPNVRFTAKRQLLSATGRKPARSFSIELIDTLEPGRRVRMAYRDAGKEGQGLVIESMEVDWPSRPERARFREGMTSEEVASVLPKNLAQLSALHVARQECFLDVRVGSPPGVERRFSVLGATGLGSAREAVMGLIHVPGLRGNPERAYQRSAVGATFPGAFPSYVASIVHQWQQDRDARLATLSDQLAALGLTWKVESRAVDDVHIELRVGRLTQARKGGAKDLVNIADVGFGVSQVLPVLVALIVAHPGQLVYIEQPELHLHPRAQGVMADVLVDSAKRGVIGVIETHSSLLVRELQSRVAEGKLLASDLALHWFTRDDAGVTSVRRAELDADGAFGDWPVDFAEVELATERRYLDAVERRHAR